jgi:DNA-binding transcriptional MerR regulator
MQELIRRQPMAKRLDISLRTLSEWERKKIIPCRKIGKRCVLFNPAEVFRALNKYRVASIGE